MSKNYFCCRKMGGPCVFGFYFFLYQDFILNVNSNYKTKYDLFNGLIPTL